MQWYSTLPPLVLGSASPRRAELLAGLHLPFQVQVTAVDEDFPASMPAAQVPGFLARKKAEAMPAQLLGERLLLCADTIVVVDDTILNKAADVDEARSMLHLLQGRSHQVFTAFCLRHGQQHQVVTDSAAVHFGPMDASEIDYYIATDKPFDKAGAYGVQDWISKAIISHIEGSFFTVMGLPTHLVYAALKAFAQSGKL